MHRIVHAERASAKYALVAAREQLGHVSEITQAIVDRVAVGA
jgi:hypothetical protein